MMLWPGKEGWWRAWPMATAVLAAGLGFQAAVQAQEPPDACRDSGGAGQLLRELNQLRMRGGACGMGALPPLMAEPRLQAEAEAMAEDLAARAVLEHRNMVGLPLAVRVSLRGYTFKLVAENLAYGQSTATAVLKGWERSEEHCENLMDRELSEVGLACRLSTDGNRTPFWVAVFGSPKVSR